MHILLFGKSDFRVIAVFFSLLALISSFCCSSSNRESRLVAVTILPQQEFVEQIAGEQSFEIMVLIPPGASPATYELSPAQMQRIGKARAYFKMGSGLPFEKTWLEKIIELNPHMKIIGCSEGIEILSGAAHAHEDSKSHGTDPHIWCSPRNAKIIIRNINRGLVDIDPAHKESYNRNASLYENKLDELDKELQTIFSFATKHDFIIFHPSWSYFAKDYGLNQIAIEIEGKEPRANDLKNLVETARRKNLKTVFASPQFNTESAEMIAREINGSVEYIDPLAKEYIENIRDVAAKLAEAMR